MTVFNGDNNQNTNSGDNPDDGKPTYVSQLVAARGDQWSDPEVIAKGKLESDKYIEELKAEMDELRKKAESGSSIKELVAKIEEEAKRSANAQTQSNGDGGTEESDTKTQVGEDQIQSLIEQTLTEREKKNTVQQNLEQVNSQLEQMFGTEAQSVVQKKAEELGLSIGKLEEVAAESPTAFLSLMGEKAKNFKPMTNGSIRTDGVNMQNSNVRNNAYWQELRKKDPRKFNLMNQQMVDDRIKMGDDFYR